MDLSFSGIQFGNLTPDLVASMAEIAAKNWMKLFSDDQELKFFKPSVFDGEEIAKPPPTAFKHGEEKWRYVIRSQEIVKPLADCCC